jgi:MYXO-CTERM domain-containing protein
MVFAGHDHVYERGEKDGVRYIVSGGGGAPLYPLGKKRSGATIAFESAHHFVDVAVDGTRVTTTARRPDGSILEKCGLDGDKSWDCSGLAPLPKPPPPKPPSTSPDAATPKKSCDCSVPGGSGSGDAPWGFGLAVALGALSRLRRARRIS